MNGTLIDGLQTHYFIRPRKKETLFYGWTGHPSRVVRTVANWCEHINIWSDDQTNPAMASVFCLWSRCILSAVKLVQSFWSKFWKALYLCYTHRHIYVIKNDILYCFKLLLTNKQSSQCIVGLTKLFLKAQVNLPPISYKWIVMPSISLSTMYHYTDELIQLVRTALYRGVLLIVAIWWKICLLFWLLCFLPTRHSFYCVWLHV